MANDTFEQALDLIVGAGQTMLENGGEVFRAQQTMEIMARSLHVEKFHVYVLTNGIFASALPESGESVSMVRHVPLVSIHLGRVEAVNELSRELAAGKLDLAQAQQKLKDARAIGDASPRVERLACIVGSGCFAFLFGGWLIEMAVAAVAGLLESIICQQFGKRHINRIFTDIIAAGLCTLWTLGVRFFVPTLDVNTATIGALMVLTPGVALTMGIRDIINADYLSGAIRLLDAVLIAGSIACGVVLAWLIGGGLGAIVW
ncbi:MAG: threonine/serine exporter family protein [Gemmiger sp.]|nr:threonine/serine exporter family protein [Gemmiger sp.]MEE0710315.1 threonine/serine exporter family protein [Gemmiger sp.]